MATQLPSPPVPVSMLRAPTDRFFCAPYKVTLLAKGCVERQALVRADARGREFSKCIGCGLGKQVEDAVGAVAPEAVRPDKHPWWAGTKAPPLQPAQRSPLPDVVALPVPVETPPNSPQRETIADEPPAEVVELGRVEKLSAPDGRAWHGSRLPDPSARKRAVSCSVTDEEQELIRAAAERADVSISKWTRDALMSSAQSVDGSVRAAGWKGKLTTTTTHSQSVELEMPAQPKVEPLALPAPADVVASAKQIGQTAADAYRKLRDERAAIAIRSAELDEQLRHLAPLACLSDRTCRPPPEVPRQQYQDQRTRHFGEMLLDDIGGLYDIIQASANTDDDYPAEWDDYIDLLNSFDAELIFYARIGLEHCASTRNGVTMASHLWRTLELAMQLGPCGDDVIATALSEDDAEALRRLTELERRGFVSQFRASGFRVTDSGKAALESPKPRKKRA